MNDSYFKIEFKSLFQTPTLSELEIVSTNPDGSTIRLNQEQLKTVRQTGYKYSYVCRSNDLFIKENSK